MQKVLVLYGSQTGSAVQVAEQIMRHCAQLHFSPSIMSLDQFLPSLPDCSKFAFIIFVCSTTGDGDYPQNMSKFWNFIMRKKCQPDLLKNTKFALFALGDSSYQRYNYTGKKLFRRLIQLGASPILDRGDGDDQNHLGIDATLDPWLDSLTEKIQFHFPIDNSNSTTTSIDLETMKPRFKIRFLDENENHSLLINTLDQSGLKSFFTAKVLKNKRETPDDHFQDVRHFEFEIPDDAKYNAGDVMILYPKNLPDDVQAVIGFFGWEKIADLPIEIKENSYYSFPTNWPRLSTIRKMLENHLDIFGKPRRYFFELIASFTNDEQHKEKLSEFGSAKGQDDLHQYCYQPRRTTFEVFSDFKSSKTFLIDYIFDLFTEIQPRYFSIASSPKVFKTRIQLLVAIVNYKTMLKVPRTGVCTKWMSKFVVGDHVQFSITAGTFKLPVSPVPIILIGPGTGIAPMRSILGDRIHDGIKSNVLIFGSRNKDKDFFYKEEFGGFIEKKELQLFTAFSRDQEEKIYVQNRILENSKLFWRLISEENSYIYLSGSSTGMPVDVVDAFKKVFVIEGKIDQDSAAELWRTLEQGKRFQKEVW